MLRKSKSGAQTGKEQELQLLRLSTDLPQTDNPLVLESDFLDSIEADIQALATDLDKTINPAARSAMVFNRSRVLRSLAEDEEYNLREQERYFAEQKMVANLSRDSHGFKALKIVDRIIHFIPGVSKLLRTNALMLDWYRRTVHAFMYASVTGDHLCELVSLMMPVSRMVIHKFEYTNLEDHPIAIKLIASYKQGKLDQTYVSRSVNWRLLEDKDVLVKAINSLKYFDLYTPPKYVEDFNDKNNEKYYEFIIGNKVYGVALDESLPMMSFSGIREIFLDLLAKRFYLAIFKSALQRQRDIEALSADAISLTNTNTDHILTHLISSAQLFHEYSGAAVIVFHAEGREMQELFGGEKYLRLDYRGTYSGSVDTPSRTALDHHAFYSDATLPHDIYGTIKNSQRYPISTHYVDHEGDINQVSLTMYAYIPNYSDIYAVNLMGFEDFLSPFRKTIENMYEAWTDALKINQEKLDAEVHARLSNYLERQEAGLPLRVEEFKVLAREGFADYMRGENKEKIAFVFHSEIMSQYSDTLQADCEYEEKILIPDRITMFVPKTLTYTNKRLSEWADKFLRLSVVSGFKTIRSLTRDTLTELYNGREFRNQLERLFKKINEHPHKEYLRIRLIMGDLSKFKLFNDTTSHAVGDNYLVRFANVLYKKFNASARLSGDEYASYEVYYIENTPVEVQRKLDKEGYVSAYVIGKKKKALEHLSTNMPELRLVFNDVPGFDEVVPHSNDVEFTLTQFILNFFILDEAGNLAINGFRQNGSGTYAYNSVIVDPAQNIMKFITEAFALVQSGALWYRHPKLQKQELIGCPDGVMCLEQYIRDNATQLANSYIMSTHFNYGYIDIDQAKDQYVYASDVMELVDAEYLKNKQA